MVLAVGLTWGGIVGLPLLSALLGVYTITGLGRFAIRSIAALGLMTVWIFLLDSKFIPWNVTNLLACILLWISVPLIETYRQTEKKQRDLTLFLSANRLGAAGNAVDELYEILGDCEVDGKQLNRIRSDLQETLKTLTFQVQKFGSGIVQDDRRLELAMMLLAIGQTSDASTLVNATVKETRQSSLIKALIAREREDWLRVLEHAEKLIDTDNEATQISSEKRGDESLVDSSSGDVVIAYRLTSEALIKLSRVREAESVYRRAILSLPAKDKTEFQLALGLLLAESGNWDEAVVNFKAVISAEPSLEKEIEQQRFRFQNHNCRILRY